MDLKKNGTKLLNFFKNKCNNSVNRISILNIIEFTIVILIYYFQLKLI